MQDHPASYKAMLLILRVDTIVSVIYTNIYIKSNMLVTTVPRYDIIRGLCLVLEYIVLSDFGVSVIALTEFVQNMLDVIFFAGRLKC